MKALAVSLLCALTLASAARGMDNVPPGVRGEAALAAPTESLVVGAIQSLAADRCVLSFALQVTADAGGGTDDFRLEIYDDQRLVRSVALSVPADGGVHGVSGTVGLPPISQSAPGIGVVLADAAVLDFEDPFLVTCAPFEVPATNAAGLVGLAALLVAAGLVVVRRRAAQA